MRVRSSVLAVLVVVSIFGTIAATSIAGVWKTESDRIPARIASGEFEGASDPADIRGSYALADVAAAFEIPVETLAEAFGVPLEIAERFRASELEELYGEIDELEVGTDSLRLFVALYLGMPHEPEASTGLPASALRVLRDRSDTTEMDTAVLSSLAERRVDLPAISLGEDGELVAGESGVTQEEAAGSGGPDGVDHAPEDQEGTVRGRTTFAELLAWGLSSEQIESVIGSPMPARGTLVRDFAAREDEPFSEWREQLHALLGAQ